MPPVGFTNGRYYTPGTQYYQDVEKDGGLSLADEALYAMAEQRGADLDEGLLEMRFRARLRPRYDYSPGAAARVERGRFDWERGVTSDTTASDQTTGRWRKAAVVTLGTAPLGEPSVPRRENGVLMAGLARPIMLTKAGFFKYGAGVDTESHSIEAPLRRDQKAFLDKTADPRARTRLLEEFDAENFAYVIASLHAVNAGFINVEDLKGVSIPLVWKYLEQFGVTSAWWSDDRQGTGVITGAAILSWAYETGRLQSGPKPLAGLVIEIFGAGAGARGVYDELVHLGVDPKDLLANDSGPQKDRSGKPYPLHQGREDVSHDPFKWDMAQHQPAGTTHETFVTGRKIDVVINLGARETFTNNRSWTEDYLSREMAPNGLVLAQTNPDPGLTPGWLKKIRPDLRYGSGNVTLKNCVNNFSAFSYIGRGSLWARARTINAPMTVAAAWAIHEVAKMGPPDWLKDQLPPEQRQFGPHWLVPHPLDIRLIEYEAGAVARTALISGVSNLVPSGHSLTPVEIADFNAWLAREAAFQTAHVVRIREEAEANEPYYFKARYGERYRPFFVGNEGWDIVPEVEQPDFENLTAEMGLSPDVWKSFLDDKGHLHPAVLSEVMKQLEVETDKPLYDALVHRERQIILRVAMIHPSLGLALALQRLDLNRTIAENGETLKTLSIFELPQVFSVSEREVPRIREAVEELLEWLRPQEAELSRLHGAPVRVSSHIPPHPEAPSIHLMHQLRQMGHEVSLHQVSHIPEAHQAHFRDAISSRNHKELARLVGEHISSDASLTPMAMGAMPTATPLALVEAVL